MIHVFWRGWGILAWLIPVLIFPLSLMLVHEWDPNLAEKRLETFAVGVTNFLGAGVLYFVIGYLKKRGKYTESDMFLYVPMKFTPYLLIGIGTVLFILESFK